MTSLHGLAVPSLQSLDSAFPLGTSDDALCLELRARLGLILVVH